MDGVSKSYGSVKVIEDVSLQVGAGEFVGLIGPNGSGKSTLLKLISGVEQATGGDTRLRDRPIGQYARKELAKWLAVLEQDALPVVGFTVREVVEMGRYPFQNWLGQESADSGETLIDDILDRLDLRQFEARPVFALSGGQRQRVALARVMAQEPLLLLLDEPTTYLDIAYQVQMMDYVRKWQVECGLTVVAVMHDLNLAAQYCTRLLVLHEGRIAADGTPQAIISSELIASVYGTEPIVLTHPVSGVPQILLQAAPAHRSEHR